MRFRVEAAAVTAREGFLDHRVCGFSWQGVRGREDHREEHGRRAQEWYSTLLDDDAAPTSGTSSPASRHDACDRLLHPTHPCSNARVEYMHVDLLTRKSSWCYRGNSIHVCIELSVCCHSGKFTVILQRISAAANTSRAAGKLTTFQVSILVYHTTGKRTCTLPRGAIAIPNTSRLRINL